jgi:DNA-binding NtrC family response regulator
MYANNQEFANACDVIAAVASAASAEPSTHHDVRPGRLQRLGALYGACTGMQRLFQTIERLGPSDVTVMILGESGSGKELVAQAIHQLSARSRKAFVAVNCGALPENLIESELFGHERGSFTGAARTHRGCFERADGGTLFLDEVTEMPVDMQVRLLRVPEQVASAVSAVIRNCGVRPVIAASNRDLDRQWPKVVRRI